MDTVRKAERRDILALINLGEEFATLSQPIHHFSVSRGCITLFTNEVVENPNCVSLVLENRNEIVGMMCGLKSMIFFSEDVALQELVWYVKKGHKGLLLLEAFEKAAVDLGVHHIIVGNKPAYYDLSKLYLRLGYTLLENQYSKQLGK